MSFHNNFTKEDLLETFDQHFDGLRNYLYYKIGDMDLTDDLVQEIFLKVWEKKAEIDKSRVKGLLFTIGNNLLIDHYRHKKVVIGHENGNGHDQMEFNSPHVVRSPAIQPRASGTIPAWLDYQAFRRSRRPAPWRP